MTSTGLKNLSGLPRLEELRLGRGALDAVAMEALTRLPALRTIDSPSHYDSEAFRSSYPRFQLGF